MTGPSPVSPSQIFEQLCRIASPSLAEADVSLAVKSELDRLGLAWKEDEAGAFLSGNCGNLITHVQGANSECSIVVCAHLDTVPPGASIEPVCVDGKWSNSGEGILGADNKASVSTILSALALWAEQPPEVNVIAVFTVAEEISLLGSKQLDFSNVNAEAAFFFDHPTPIGTLIDTSPSHHTIEIEFTGLAAHAGVAPEEGASAIRAAARAIELYPSGRLDSQTTSNIGTIEGGTAINVVPEMCRVLAEVRSPDATTLTRETQLIIEAAHEGAGKYGCSADVVVKPSFRGYKHTDEHRGVQIAEAALRSVGIEPTRIASAGGSDANVFEEHGIPSVNLGDGSWSTHTSDEGIADADLERLVQLILELPRAAAQQL